MLDILVNHYEKQGFYVVPDAFSAEKEDKRNQICIKEKVLLRHSKMEEEYMFLVVAPLCEVTAESFTEAINFNKEIHIVDRKPFTDKNTNLYVFVDDSEFSISIEVLKFIESDCYMYRKNIISLSRIDMPCLLEYTPGKTLADLLSVFSIIQISELLKLPLVNKNVLTYEVLEPSRVDELEKELRGNIEISNDIQELLETLLSNRLGKAVSLDNFAATTDELQVENLSFIERRRALTLLIGLQTVLTNSLEGVMPLDFYNLNESDIMFLLGLVVKFSEKSVVLLNTEVDESMFRYVRYKMLKFGINQKN